MTKSGKNSKRHTQFVVTAVTDQTRISRPIQNQSITIYPSQFTQTNSTLVLATPHHSTVSSDSSLSSPSSSPSLPPQPWIGIHIYFLFSLAFAFFTVEAFRKPAKLKTMVTFGPPMLVNEASHFFLILQFIGLYQAYKNRAAVMEQVKHNVISKFSLSLNTFTFLGSLFFFYNNFRSRNNFKQALIASRIHSRSIENGVQLITDSQIQQSIGRMSVSRWFMMLFPVFKLIHYLHSVEKQSGIPFHKMETVHKTRTLKLDVYKLKEDNPEKTTRGLPIFIYYHGGGWITGHRAYHSIPLLASIAESGWLVFSVNYRLAPYAKHSSQIIDCKRAIAWIKEHAAAYGGDSSVITVGGESAGGNLASLLGLTPNNPYYQPGFENVDTSVQAVVDLYGLRDFSDKSGSIRSRSSGSASRFYEMVIGVTHMDNEAMFEQASPIYQLQHLPYYLIPPFFIAHGTIDTLIPIEDAQEFVRVLKSRRAERSQPIHPNQHVEEVEANSAEKKNDEPVEDVYVEVEGAHHAFNSLPSPRTYALSDSVCCFLNAVVASIYKKQPSQKAHVLLASDSTAVVSGSFNQVVDDSVLRSRL